MLARVVTLRFDPGLEAFDDTPLQDLLKANEVFAIREHFFVRNEVPYLAVLVTYGLRPAAAQTGAGARDPARTPWRPPVPEADLPLWNALRDWRAERARRDGVPPYVIVTNRQMAAMVERRPGSMSALGAIEGIGKAKLGKYGQELLALLARPRPDPGAAREAREPEAMPVPGTLPEAERSPPATAPPPGEAPSEPPSSAPPALFGEGKD